MSTNLETRRAIAQRAIDRAKSRGAPIDEDPVFVDLLESWINGDLDMKTMRKRYLDNLALGKEERHVRKVGQAQVLLDSENKKKGPTE